MPEPEDAFDYDKIIGPSELTNAIQDFTQIQARLRDIREQESTEDLDLQFQESTKNFVGKLRRMY